MSEEEVALSSLVVEEHKQPNIYVNTNVDKNNIEIKVTAHDTHHNDETLTLMDTGTADTDTPNTSSDFVNIDSNPSTHPSENDSNHSNGSKHEYVIVSVDQNAANTPDQDDNPNPASEDKPLRTDDPVAVDPDTIPPYTQTPMNSTVLSSNQSMESIGSEPAVTNVTKAMILCTFVPKHNTGAELTVLAGEMVTVLESEPITLMDNPLALMNTPSGEIDKIIILNSMHWTQIQSRNGKGVVPSNILSYDANPMHHVWTKVTIEHSYMAKAQNQLSISSNERLQIHGVVTDDGMILAKRKDGAQGLIPYNFVEIPAAQMATSTKSALGVRHSISSTTYCEDVHHRNRSSLSSQHSLGNGAPTSTSDALDDKRSSVQLVIADMSTIHGGQSITHDVEDSDALELSTKHKLTKRIKKFSISLSTTIDKIQYASYKPRTSSLEIISHKSKFTAPTGVDSDQIIDESPGKSPSPYQWDAPLNWRRVYVLQDFNGTQSEIETVYQLFIQDKQSRGRNESILNYVSDPESDIMSGDDGDQYDAAVPSLRKKTEKEVLKVTTHDVIEIAGDPSPEGWVFARLVEDKERRGFVPMSYVQTLDTQTTNSEAQMHAMAQHHPLNTLAPSIHEEEDETQTTQTENDVISNSTDVASLEQEQLGSVSPDIDTAAYMGELSPTANQSLPLHWPFSSYPVNNRTKRSKVIESTVMFILLLISALPIMVEYPGCSDPTHTHTETHSRDYVWWVNLWLVCVPWIVIFVLRMLELWTIILSKKDNPNNRLYATLLFYLMLLVYFIGLFVVIIATFVEYEWIREHSPVLGFATMVEVIVFMGCAVLLIFTILFIFIWTFCCRISRNRWETRIEFYCCGKGDHPVATKRYPRNK